MQHTKSCKEVIPIHNNPNPQHQCPCSCTCQDQNQNQKYNQYISHINQAHKHANQRRYTQAQQCYQNALQLNPESYEANLNLGWIMQRKPESQDQAIKFYTKASECLSSSFEPFYRLGTVHYTLKNVEEGIKYFDIAIKMNPSLLQAYYYKGILCSLQFKEVAIAQQCFEKVRQLNKKWQRVYECLLDNYFYQQKFIQIEDMLQKLIQQFPDCQKPYYLAYQYYRQIGNTEKEIEMYYTGHMKCYIQGHARSRFQNYVFLEGRRGEFGMYRCLADLVTDRYNFIEKSKFSFIKNDDVRNKLKKAKRQKISNFLIKFYDIMLRVLSYYLMMSIDYRDNQKKYLSDIRYCRVLIRLEESGHDQIDSGDVDAMVALLGNVCFQYSPQQVAKKIFDCLGKENTLENVEDLVIQCVLYLQGNAKFRQYIYKTIVQDKPQTNQIKTFIKNNTGDRNKQTKYPQWQNNAKEKDKLVEEHAYILLAIMIKKIQYKSKIIKFTNPFIQVINIWMQDL